MSERERPEIGSLQVGRRDHYLQAAELVASGPRRVVLSQRSSTMVLGPEQGWEAEHVFYDAAWANVERGAEWFHLTSTRGIADHLARATSHFPHRHLARARLNTDGSIVGIPHQRGAVRAIKDVARFTPGPDLKLDRQARLIAADFGDDFAAIIVENVGEQQVTLGVGGELAAQLFEVCHRLWLDCPPLMVDDLDVM